MYAVIVPSLSRPEFELQLSPELIGPVGPGQRRALQYRPLDRVIIELVPARLSELRGKHFARRQLYDVEDRFRVSLEVGRRNDSGPDSRNNFFYVPGVAHGSGRRRKLLQHLLALAAPVERLLFLRELLPDALGGIELERRLLLLWFLFFTLDGDVGLRLLLLDLGLRLRLRLDLGLGLRWLDRRQLAPEFGHDGVRVPRLPAQAENQHREEHHVH